MQPSSAYPATPPARSNWIRERREPVSRPTENTIPDVLVEEELGPDGHLLNTGIIFLINRECPWNCVMCDLWKNTTLTPLPPGHAPSQIQVALGRINANSNSNIQQIKIYNSGSFFDTRAIYPEDYTAIASSVSKFERVIVENHPKLIGGRVAKFNELLKPHLEIAMGLEAADDGILQKLNKRFTLDDYAKACDFMNVEGIDHRAFIMVQPPFSDPDQAVELCTLTVQFAFEQNASSVTLIPTRSTTGAMKSLTSMGVFTQPSLATLETCFEQALLQSNKRVFVDLWDLEKFQSCDECFDSRKRRLLQMNQLQRILVKPHCLKCH